MSENDDIRDLQSDQAELSDDLDEMADDLGELEADLREAAADSAAAGDAAGAIDRVQRNMEHTSRIADQAAEEDLSEGIIYESLDSALYTAGAIRKSNTDHIKSLRGKHKTEISAGAAFAAAGAMSSAAASIDDYLAVEPSAVFMVAASMNSLGERASGLGLAVTTPTVPEGVFSELARQRDKTATLGTGALQFLGEVLGIDVSSAAGIAQIQAMAPRLSGNFMALVGLNAGSISSANLRDAIRGMRDANTAVNDWYNERYGGISGFFYKAGDEFAKLDIPVVSHVGVALEGFTVGMYNVARGFVVGIGTLVVHPSNLWSKDFYTGMWDSTYESVTALNPVNLINGKHGNGEYDGLMGYAESTGGAALTVAVSLKVGGAAAKSVNVAKAVIGGKTLTAALGAELQTMYVRMLGSTAGNLDVVARVADHVPGGSGISRTIASVADETAKIGKHVEFNTVLAHEIAPGRTMVDVHRGNVGELGIRGATGAKLGSFVDTINPWSKAETSAPFMNDPASRAARGEHVDPTIPLHEVARDALGVARDRLPDSIRDVHTNVTGIVAHKLDEVAQPLQPGAVRNAIHAVSDKVADWGAKHETTLGATDSMRLDPYGRNADLGAGAPRFGVVEVDDLGTPRFVDQTPDVMVKTASGEWVVPGAVKDADGFWQYPDPHADPLEVGSADPSSGGSGDGASSGGGSTRGADGGAWPDIDAELRRVETTAISVDATNHTVNATRPESVVGSRHDDVVPVADARIDSQRVHELVQDYRAGADVEPVRVVAADAADGSRVLVIADDASAERYVAGRMSGRDVELELGGNHATVGTPGSWSDHREFALPHDDVTLLEAGDALARRVAGDPTMTAPHAVLDNGQTVTQFMGSADPVNLIRNVGDQPLVPAAFQDAHVVQVHGNPESMAASLPDGTWRPIEPEDLAALVRANPNFVDGQPIYLVVCEAGALPDGVAARFASQFPGTDVFADFGTVTNGRGLIDGIGSRSSEVVAVHFYEDGMWHDFPVTDAHVYDGLPDFVGGGSRTLPTYDIGPGSSVEPRWTGDDQFMQRDSRPEYHESMPVQHTVRVTGEQPIRFNIEPATEHALGVEPQPGTGGVAGMRPEAREALLNALERTDPWDNPLPTVRFADVESIDAIADVVDAAHARPDGAYVTPTEHGPIGQAVLDAADGTTKQWTYLDDIAPTDGPRGYETAGYKLHIYAESLDDVASIADRVVPALDAINADAKFSTGWQPFADQPKGVTVYLDPSRALDADVAHVLDALGPHKDGVLTGDIQLGGGVGLRYDGAIEPGGFGDLVPTRYVDESGLIPRSMGELHEALLDGSFGRAVPARAGWAELMDDWARARDMDIGNSTPSAHDVGEIYRTGMGAEAARNHLGLAPTTPDLPAPPMPTTPVAGVGHPKILEALPDGGTVHVATPDRFAMTITPPQDGFGISTARLSADQIVLPSDSPASITTGNVIAIHGSPTGFVIPLDNGGTMLVSARELADHLRAQPGFLADAPVTLVSCEPGAGMAAQQLANELGVRVDASENQVIVMPTEQPGLAHVHEVRPVINPDGLRRASEELTTLRGQAVLVDGTTFDVARLVDAEGRVHFETSPDGAWRQIIRDDTGEITGTFQTYMPHKGILNAIDQVEAVADGVVRQFTPTPHVVTLADFDPQPPPPDVRAADRPPPPPTPDSTSTPAPDPAPTPDPALTPDPATSPSLGARAMDRFASLFRIDGTPVGTTPVVSHVDGGAAFDAVIEQHISRVDDHGARVVLDDPASPIAQADRILLGEDEWAGSVVSAPGTARGVDIVTPDGTHAVLNATEFGAGLGRIDELESSHPLLLTDERSVSFNREVARTHEATVMAPVTAVTPVIDGGAVHLVGHAPEASRAQIYEAQETYTRVEGDALEGTGRQIEYRDESGRLRHFVTDEGEWRTVLVDSSGRYANVFEAVETPSTPLAQSLHDLRVVGGEVGDSIARAVQDLPETSRVRSLVDAAAPTGAHIDAFDPAHYDRVYDAPRNMNPIGRLFELDSTPKFVRNDELGGADTTPAAPVSSGPVTSDWDTPIFTGHDPIMSPAAGGEAVAMVTRVPVAELAPDGVMSQAAERQLLGAYGDFVGDTESAALAQVHMRLEDALAELPAHHVTPSQEAIDRARALLDGVRAAEPSITSHLVDTARATDGAMVGLDQRLKTELSLARKVDADGVLNDALRYTQIHEPDVFHESVRAVSAELREHGYSRMPEASDYRFGTTGYQGYNTTWTSPDGVQFELQFHTPESYVAKTTMTHVPYEVMRHEAFVGTTEAQLAQHVRSIYGEQLQGPVTGPDAWVPQVVGIAPDGVLPSQPIVGYEAVQDLAAAMREHGWVGGPVHMVEMPNGELVTVDHHRVVAARIAGIEAETVVHSYEEPIGDRSEFLNEKLVKKWRSRFGADLGASPTTWGEFAQYRAASGPASFTDAYKEGASADAFAYRNPGVDVGGETVRDWDVKRAVVTFLGDTHGHDFGSIPDRPYVRYVEGWDPPTESAVPVPDPT